MVENLVLEPEQNLLPVGQKGISESTASFALLTLNNWIMTSFGFVTSLSFYGVYTSFICLSEKNRHEV